MLSPRRKNGCPLPSVIAGHVSDNWLRRRQRRADHQPRIHPGGDLTVSHYDVQVIHNPVETFSAFASLVSTTSIVNCARSNWAATDCRR